MFKKGLKSMLNNRGQVTIFIIIAVIIVAATLAFFIFRGSLIPSTVSANLVPVYNSFLSCLEENTLTGVSILESQGGYIEMPTFEPGSAYMPFSSQLDFLGNPIPYWYYVSGNNVPKMQVPTRTTMQNQLADFIDSRIQNCIFDSYFENGFAISIGEPKSNVIIGTNNVEVNLNMDFGIEKANESAVVSSHNIVVKTNLGSLYDSAKKVYDYEQSSLFLENYGVDTLRLYAPVDGVELTCSPKIWNANDVFEELKVAIEENTLALRASGTDFTLAQKENQYFVVDLPVTGDVRFLNSKNWTYSYEVQPSEGAILIAKPVGTQPGMVALGFCYVPYHFVYNVNYPVLIQVYSGLEVFQFPMAVVIKGNKPREALSATASASPIVDLCQYKNTPIEIRTYDYSMNPVSANVSFQCFSESCSIGQTDENGELVGLFPQCANGFAVATADGYLKTKAYLSSVNPGYVDIFMKPVYGKEINLLVDGQSYNGEAIISFISNDTTTTILYPEQKLVELVSGQYEVQVYIYKNASIELKATTQQKCMDVPQTGLGGLFGVTREKCFDITIPAQTISNALSSGGKQNYYIADSELESGTIIDINADSFPLPKSIDDLQENYNLLENTGLDINFR